MDLDILLWFLLLANLLVWGGIVYLNYTHPYTITEIVCHAMPNQTELENTSDEDWGYYYSCPEF